MIECPNCHAKHVANSLICTECGTFLPTETDEFALPGDAGLSWGGVPTEPVTEVTMSAWNSRSVWAAWIQPPAPFRMWI